MLKLSKTSVSVDVLAMIELLQEHGVVTDAEIDLAKQNKFNKLRKWSTIYE